MVASLLFAALALSPWFLPPETSPSNHVFGIGYMPHQVVQPILFGVLLIHASSEISNLKGFARSMAKLFFIGGGVTSLISAGFLMIAKHLSRPELFRGAPLVASAFYVVGAWAVSSQQLLDTRHHMLTVLRRAIGLIATAFIVTWLIDRIWSLPRELQVLIATASGLMLALFLDSVSGLIFDRSLMQASFEASCSLQKFSTEIAALPVAELRETAAQCLAKILSTNEVAIYWRSDANQPLRLVSSYNVLADCRTVLSDEHALIWISGRERTSWWLSRRLSSIEDDFGNLALCVPVLEQSQVLLIILTGHKRSVLGFTQPEIAALQAWALACHHTLTTRALLERENAQQQLVYAGKLAAGIAHNLRNPLAIVRAYVEADPSMAKTNLEELHDFALKETARIQSTVDGLMALSRGERFALEPHSLPTLVARALELNHSYFAESRARVEMVPPTTDCRVMAEPWQFTTALTNLLRNSAEEVAREGGGWIRIEMGVGAPGWVEVRVRDSGRGLPEHIRDAVFTRDLFAQTTKAIAATGRRTGFGVGLHSTMLIVTIGHGGQFAYRDGAFVMTLPAAA